MLRIILGLVAVAIGALMVIKTDGFVRTFGTVPWAEAHLSGGTYSFYKWFGIIVIVVGFLAATGLIGNVLLWLLRPLFGGALG